MPVLTDLLEDYAYDQPLKLILSFSNINVTFGKFDTDVVLEYTLHYKIGIDGGKELFYDKIDIISSANIAARNDIVFINVLNHKISENKLNKKSLPIRNGIGMTKKQY